MAGERGWNQVFSRAGATQHDRFARPRREDLRKSIPGSSSGDPGPPGADGNTWHTVSGVPSNTLGVNGDYAFDPTTDTYYGPKAAGVYPTGVSLRGSDGVDGSDGVGVPPGGTTGQALVKGSNTDYDTQWSSISGGGASLGYYEPMVSGDPDGELIFTDDGDVVMGWIDEA